MEQQKVKINLEILNEEKERIHISSLYPSSYLIPQALFSWRPQSLHCQHHDIFPTEFSSSGIQFFWAQLSKQPFHHVIFLLKNLIPSNFILAQKEMDRYACVLIFPLLQYQEILLQTKLVALSFFSQLLIILIFVHLFMIFPFAWVALSISPSIHDHHSIKIRFNIHLLLSLVITLIFISMYYQPDRQIQIHLHTSMYIYIYIKFFLHVIYFPN